MTPLISLKISFVNTVVRHVFIFMYVRIRKRAETQILLDTKPNASKMISVLSFAIFHVLLVHLNFDKFYTENSCVNTLSSSDFRTMVEIPNSPLCWCLPLFSCFSLRAHGPSILCVFGVSGLRAWGFC